MRVRRRVRVAVRVILCATSDRIQAASVNQSDCPKRGRRRKSAATRPSISSPPSRAPTTHPSSPPIGLGEVSLMAPTCLPLGAFPAARRGVMRVRRRVRVAVRVVLCATSDMIQAASVNQSDCPKRGRRRKSPATRPSISSPPRRTHSSPFVFPYRPGRSFPHGSHLPASRSLPSGEAGSNASEEAGASRRKSGLMRNQ